jgi:hypothetical protein
MSVWTDITKPCLYVCMYVWLKVILDAWKGTSRQMLIDFIQVGGKSLRSEDHQHSNSSERDEESINISTIRTL